MNDAILNTATLRNLRTATLTASIAEGPSGALQPQVQLRFPRGTYARRGRAALHALAAIVELATPSWERWVVVVDRQGDNLGRVYLALADGDAEEARRGLATLERAIA